MKKILFILASLCLLGVSTTHAQTLGDSNPFFYGNENKEGPAGVEKTEIATILKQENINQDTTTPNKTPLIYQLRGLFGLTSTDGNSVYNDTKNQGQPAIAYIKMLTNMALGLVSFISLILVIFAFYLIFFGKGEDAVDKAKKILIGVAIALVVMAISRIIVNTLFTLFNDQTKNI